MKRAGGFTLVELTITVLVAGILTAVAAPLVRGYLVARDDAYRERSTLDNQRIASALLDYAATATLGGTLPEPFTGGGYTSTVFNPVDTSAEGLALRQGLLATGIAANAINDDGYGSKRVRVYQRVAGIAHEVPLYYRSGPLVTLTYDYAVVYQSSCPLGNAACNPTATTGVPGASPALTEANFATWEAAEGDVGAVHLSTLPLQMAMLSATTQRLDRVRDALTAHLRVHQVTAAAGDTTNWFPAPTPTLAGKNPLTNQGCRDGWYSLSTSTVLPAVGLAPEEYGVTAWGGEIEFCRDYDPDGSGAPNAPPHYAALRINRAASAGLPPSAALPASNVVLTF